MKYACMLATVLLLLCATAHAVEATESEIIRMTTWLRDGEFLIDTTMHPFNLYNPAVAFDGTNYLVAWQCEEYYGDISIARAAPDGTVLDPPILMETGYQTPNMSDPAIAFDGTNYLVVFWHHGLSDQGIKCMRVSPDGTVLDIMNPVSICGTTTTPPSIAFDGINYMVLWSHWSGSGVYGARVTPDRIVLDPEGFPVATGHNEQYAAVAFDGTNYLAVWQCSRNDSSNIYGARVSPDGVVLDPVGIPISAAVDSQRLPAVAFDGTNYLVVWQDRRNGSEYNIYGARVSQGGTVLDSAGIAIATAVGDQCAPSVAFNGSSYVIAWRDERSGVSSDIYGATMNTLGTIIDSFDISIQSGDQITPAVGHGPSDQVLITYSGWTDSINGQPVNAMRIWGKFYPFVGIEEGETNIVKQRDLDATIFRGPLHLPEGKKCRVYDITGRVVEPNKITRGIYIIEIDNKIVQKVIKIR